MDEQYIRSVLLQLFIVFYIKDIFGMKIKDENKLFGRNKYLNSVIFEGNEKNIGKIVNVKVDSCNQNSLFGKIKLEKNMEAA